ncbi:hypothetical protein ACFOEQ_08765 [Chryseobacterium arachidis]|uniref:hypothetical protein n=1 Tax=Chryseobacterium arachidis TaxID=1416778 RepID=UPI0036087A81
MWFPYGIAASLLIGSGIFYFTNKNDSGAVTKSVIAQNVVSQKHIEIAVPEHIQKIDSTVKVNIQNEILPPSPGIIAYEPIAPKYIRKRI